MMLNFSRQSKNVSTCSVLGLTFNLISIILNASVYSIDLKWVGLLHLAAVSSWYASSCLAVALGSCNMLVAIII